MPKSYDQDLIYFHQQKSGDLTVSKSAVLPDGDFEITEYQCGKISLWFVNLDEFNADERQIAYESFILNLMEGLI